jgi:hypothetical protein
MPVSPTQTNFRIIAREWWHKFMAPRSTPKYAAQVWRVLERDALPILGDMPLPGIDPPMILSILRRIEDRGTVVTAHKLKSHISQIMRYGIACGYTYSNPARDLTYALKPRKNVPRAALTEPRQIGMLMRRIAEYKSLKRRCSLKFAALTFVRPGEICQAEWSEIEWDDAIWRIPAAKMKMKRPHNENETSAYGSPSQTDAGCAAGTADVLRAGAMVVSIALGQVPPRERERAHHCDPAHGLHRAGNDRARVPCHGRDDAVRAGMGE